VFVDTEELLFEAQIRKRNEDERLKEMGVWVSGKSLEGLLRFARNELNRS
jgi:hypothetical protein